MQIDLSNIVKYDSATNALTNGATTVLDIDNITDNLLTYDTATGQIEYDSAAITGIASMTFAQMEALTADQLLALAGMPIHINDIHCNAAGIGGVYMVRDSSPAGWAQISKPWYYAAVSNFPTGSAYTDFEFFATGVGLYGTRYKYDGADFRINQESSVIARSITPSKAVVLPTDGWTVSSCNTTSLGAGLLRLVGAGTHGLTAAQTTTLGNTYIAITAGTGWTPGLYKLNSVTDSTSNLIIEAASTANVPTVTSAKIDGSAAAYLPELTFTVPPLNKYGELEVDITCCATVTGTMFMTPKILYAGSLMILESAPTTGATAGTYSYRSGPASFRNRDNVSIQTGTNAKLATAASGGVALGALQADAINSGVAQTVTIGIGSNIANQRCWVDQVIARIRG